VGTNIVDVVEIVEDETSFGIVLHQAGKPLSTKIARTTRGRWLKDLSNRQARILFWRNMARIAKAIGIVHSHGLVHGRVDSSAIMTEGRQERDFLLGGFEWSLWFGAGEGKESHAGLSARHAAARAEKPYSFEDDWRSFGALIADSLGVDITVSGEIALPEGADHTFVDTSEKALLRRLTSRAPSYEPRRCICLISCMKSCRKSSSIAVDVFCQSFRLNGVPVERSSTSKTDEANGERSAAGIPSPKNSNLFSSGGSPLFRILSAQGRLSKPEWFVYPHPPRLT
jgi:hypothetical protein